ncbi:MULTISPECIES: bacteriocin [unclassified Streptococcus]|uniref:bacteriocin n=1 Tax=unclassified Streptococcus TaxID=2608887 RepID=UPI0018A909D7|nr:MULTISPECIES: bacteriocin [unclassified Streptococcus]MBF8969483.1 bacteriocin [Streptococcus sp. NLN76]MBG9368139.1 bacteriocin [Streptococcus sp. NLN64]
MNQLTTTELISIQGSGETEANLFLSGFYGAFKGIAFCSQAIPLMTPQLYAACAVTGAAGAVLFPH